ncbi:hypothetical protein MAC_04391 [Metarhizium acridum CQMa 102]|uniref:Uncharacterized protein n=1 Tax=Metarhizium acridum (strain CQMa 102) TaxID=655827 RepID=E9E3E3_METAQ|nr:uncharacterized protein MAC_04391 [Metarhizium acridum CQMa 102]EFY89536.1 hypothetical protein MAC_04391 [Metarhizium acridum CQMa 102]
MEKSHHELYCAAAIANMEGCRKLPFPLTEAKETTRLPFLEDRVRTLEAAIQITQPPPDTEQSWTGLAFRIWRLRGRMQSRGMAMMLVDHPWPAQDDKSMLPNLSGISVQDIQKAIDSIRTFAPRTLWPKEGSVDEMLSFVLQKLCHIAGWRNNSLRTIPVTPVDMYICALKQSLLAEVSGPVGPMPFVPPPRPQPKKLSCGCCGCTCHKAPVHFGILRHGHGERSLSQGSKQKFSWLKKLLFWRKKEVDDIASTCSSGSSTAIVD